jgi:type I restriction enzyme S subunit
MKQDWDIKKLGDICEYGNGLWTGKKPPFINVGVIRNTNFTKEGKLDDSDIVYLDVEKSQFVKRMLKYGDIILEKSGGGPKQPVGRVVIFDKEVGNYSFSNFTSLIRIKNPNQIDFNYLHLYLFFSYISGVTETMQSHSTGIRNLKFDEYKQISVPIPPLPEQKRIVAILAESFASIAKAKANTEQNLNNARELFESYLQSVFASKGEGWEEKTLGEIGKVSMCKRIYKNQTASNGDIPFYKIGTFGKEPDAFIPYNIYNEYREKYSFPKKGAILISASGTIGRRVKYDGEPAYFQDSNIMWLDNDEKQVLNDYLFYFYGACKWNSTKGATISRLYYDNLKSIEIAYPKSRTEQQSIVQKLDTISSETKKFDSIYQQKLNDLEELKKSILQKAFKGDL